MFTSMISLLLWSVHRLQLAALLVCLTSVVIITSIYPAVIFMSVMNTDHVSRKKPSLGHHVWHNTNCSVGSIYCSENSSQDVSHKSRSLGHISARMVTSIPLHNGCPVHLVPLSNSTTEGAGSLEYYTDVSLSHDVSRVLFQSRKVVIWSTDHHPAPAYDVKHLLEPLGVVFLQHDLSPYCRFFNVCAQRNSLKVSCLACSLCSSCRCNRCTCGDNTVLYTFIWLLIFSA